MKTSYTRITDQSMMAFTAALMMTILLVTAPIIVPIAVQKASAVVQAIAG